MSGVIRIEGILALLQSLESMLNTTNVISSAEMLIDTCDALNAHITQFCEHSISIVRPLDHAALRDNAFVAYFTCWFRVVDRFISVFVWPLSSLSPFLVLFQHSLDCKGQDSIWQIFLKILWESTIQSIFTVTCFGMLERMLHLVLRWMKMIEWVVQIIWRSIVSLILHQWCWVSSSLSKPM